MNKKSSLQQGFTLIELMIVVAIIGILAAIAVPAYSNYTDKAKFSGVITMTSGFKTGIESCIANGDCITATAGTPSIGNVTAGSNGVPVLPTFPAGNLNLLSVTTAGVITATPIAVGGLSSKDTYILTPTLDAGDEHVIWTKSGGCLIHPGGVIC